MIELLVQARKDVGVTQVELGKRLGLRQTFVSKVELGERRLDAAEFIIMCRAVPVDPYSLMLKAEESMN
ncbi:helix-turn-helix domain-containing protein [Phyllobacterium ifriqiyense]|uniref:helix-turn-helix domain-containing protein n=1 Tax=Phyllobacterium ifriqiyense TaxID=314238 RepID=UPI00339727C6